MPFLSYSDRALTAVPIPFNPAGLFALSFRYRAKKDKSDSLFGFAVNAPRLFRAWAVDAISWDSAPCPYDSFVGDVVIPEAFGAAKLPDLDDLDAALENPMDDESSTFLAALRAADPSRHPDVRDVFRLYEDVTALLNVLSMHDIVENLSPATGGWIRTGNFFESRVVACLLTASRPKCPYPRPKPKPKPKPKKGHTS